MKTRRGNNEGSITKRADGRWMARVTIGFVNGKLQRKAVYGKTREEAALKMREIQRKLDRGIPVQSSSPLVKDYLAEWLQHRRDNLAPRTYVGYQRVIDHYLVPAIGHLKIERLTQRHVAQLFKQCKQAGLAPSSVQNVRKILRAALNDAMKLDLITRNVAVLVTGPKVPRFEGKALTVEEADAFLAAAQESRYQLLYRVALTLGLRQGEILGLSWSDIDFENRVIQVRRQLQRIEGVQVLRELKTERSRRVVPLSDPMAIDFKHRRTAQLEDRLRAGGTWNGSWDLVFTSGIGTPVDPPALRIDFLAVLKAAGLPPMRFHDLRHSAASFMAASGVHLSHAQAILGHSSVVTTAQVYTHVKVDSMREAIASLEGMLGAEKRVI